MSNPKELLKQYFGYDEFRSNQEEIVSAILNGRDVLAVMPTGAGKSICYQVPALCLGGLTLVVSPLISLMKDQVNALEQTGISAAFLNSTQYTQERRDVMERAASGDVTLLYVAPERIDTPEFRTFCQHVQLSLIAIDEAHCISQWGQDFRPSYTRIKDFVDGLEQRPPLCAFTATATREVREDIERSLELRDPFRVLASFDRPNLHFEVMRPKDKDKALVGILKKREGKSGIIYCTTRKSVEEVCFDLRSAGINACRYHAGLSADERKKNQDDFIFDRVPVIVATNAFGMGIDKSNVSFVIHYNMPFDIESYYQEAGRAGRDGEPADCILLYAPRDVNLAEYIVQKGLDEADDVDDQTRTFLERRATDRLRQMTFYSTTQDCLRGFLLHYFGENAPLNCENCSNCEMEFEVRDVTTDAAKIISCVYRLAERGRTMGKVTIIDVLRGMKKQKILDSHFDELSTYGIMADSSGKYIRFVLDSLIERGILDLVGVEYPVVAFTAESARFLHDHDTFKIKVPKETAKRKKVGGTSPSDSVVYDGPYDEALYEELRRLRMEIASEEEVPAYVVFANATLADMARKMPLDDESFREVRGVGSKKAERYGERFIAAIKQWKEK